MNLHDDIKTSFEAVKRKLKAEQDRKVISRDIMPFQYANGRVMFNAEKTRELVAEYAVHGSMSSVISRIADEMLKIKELSMLTVGYARNTKMEFVFTFLYLDD